MLSKLLSIEKLKKQTGLLLIWHENSTVQSYILFLISSILSMNISPFMNWFRQSMWILQSQRILDFFLFSKSFSAFSCIFYLNVLLLGVLNCDSKASSYPPPTSICLITSEHGWSWVLFSFLAFIKCCIFPITPNHLQDFCFFFLFYSAFHHLQGPSRGLRLEVHLCVGVEDNG